MRTLYATQFRIEPHADQKNTDLAGLVSEEVIAWMAERYDVETKRKLRAFDGHEHSPRRDHLLRSLIESGNGCALVTLQWHYPHEDDPSLLWHSVCQIAVASSGVEFSINTRIGSVAFTVRPLEYQLGRPRVVPTILNKFDCRIGAHRVPAVAAAVGIGEVRRFAADVLLSASRSIPVVVVSPELYRDTPTVDPDKLQDAVAGVAMVTNLVSKWAAYELTDVLGAKLSCYDGAVRIYWPGFAGREQEAPKHRLFMAESIRQHIARGNPLSRHLFKSLAAISAFRFAEGTIAREARVAVESASRAKFDALVEKSRQGDSSGDQELLDLALKENVELASKLRERDETISNLQRDVATYAANLEAMAQFTGEDDVSLEDAATGPQEVGNVVEALAQVGDQYESLLIFKSAVESAKESDFSRPEDIKKALLAIAELSQLYFEAKGKQSIGRWDDFFEQRGLKYAHTESQTTATMYGDERKFLHEGRRVQMFKHLTIGKGDTRNCAQIYFEPNDKNRQFEIGYCGRHLSYARQRT